MSREEPQVAPRTSYGVENGLSLASPSTSADVLNANHPAFAENWSPAKKLFVVSTSLFINFNTCLSSALPSGAVSALARAFSLTTVGQTSLPVALFLCGYIFGPIIFGPMSESFGRKPCFLSSFGLYTLSTLACALAPNWPALLLFRLLNGIGASAPQYILGGVYADLYPNLVHRGRAVMVSGLMNNFGPLVGPVIAGYTSEQNWRWMFWIALILAGCNWPMLLFIPETFPPIIRSRLEKSQKRESEVKDGTNMGELLTVCLMRPIRMFAEPLVFFTDLFLLYQYSIYFLAFQAYPIIFKGAYGMSEGKVSLMLLPIGVGGVLAVPMFLWYDRFLATQKSLHKPWALREEYRRLPLACVGGPLYALSLFWLAWTAKPSIHWAVPMLSGVLFGIGIDLTFMALTNYITDAYDIYSASALASSVFSRNIAAALLITLATAPMYERLGVGWACTLLGCVCLVLSPIPFAFVRWGPRLRERSPFCKQLKRTREEMEDEVEGTTRDLERRRAVEQRARIR